MRAQKSLLQTSLCALLAFLLLWAAAPAQAATIYVPGDNAEVCTLDKAITTANDGLEQTGCTTGDGSGPDTIILTANFRVTEDTETITSDITFRSSSTSNKNFYICGAESNGQCEGTNPNPKPKFRLLHINDASADVVVNNLIIKYGKNDNGGGIYVQNANTVSINNSTIHGNISTATSGANGGGGIYAGTGALTIENSSIYDNKTSTQLNTTSGGGILIRAAGTGNAATTIRNSTFKGNSGNFGGAISINLTSSGTVNLEHITIAENTVNQTASAAANGLNIVGSNTVVNLRNSLLKDNGDGSACLLGSGATLNRTNNLIYDPDDTVDSCGSPHVNEDPQLGSFTNGYFPLKTSPTKSPAIDAASSTYCPATDQRGYDRPASRQKCDIGAYEVDATNTITVDSDCSLTQAITSANTNTDTEQVQCEVGAADAVDLIVLTKNEELTADLPAISSDISFQGNSYTIDGNNHRIFNIGSGPVSVSYLKFENGSSANGGAINCASGATSLTINNSVFRSNSSSGHGGAIRAICPLTLNNSSFSANSATSNGGAIFVGSNATATLKHITIADNSAAAGNGIYRDSGGSGALNLSNSIIKQGSGGNACSGLNGTNTNNFISSGCAGTVTADPKLGAFNGQYYALMPGSGAMDAGADSICAELSYDQRTLSRPTTACDIGAIESDNAIIKVDADDPDVNCSLGEALESVRDRLIPGGSGCVQGARDVNTIDFEENVTLSALLPTISTANTIFQGDGHSIDGGMDSNNSGGRQIFSIENANNVIINNLSFANGHGHGNVNAGFRKKGNGGAIYIENSRVTINNSVFRNNRSSLSPTTCQIGCRGGAIYVEGAGSRVSINSSTFSGNYASQYGGALYVYSDVANGALTLRHVTLAANTANTNGTGIYNQAYANAVNIYNSIIDASGSGSAQPACTGQFSPPIGENINNFISSGCTGTVTADPKLGAFNGQYYALMPGSGAMDAGADSVCAALPYDQRTLSRPSTACDIGAIESHNAIIKVDADDPDIDCSLGEALESVRDRLSPGGSGCVQGARDVNTIDFEENVTLSALLPTISKANTIFQGDGHSIDGGMDSNNSGGRQIFSIESANNVIINNLSFANGHGHGNVNAGFRKKGNGGAIYIENSRVTINNSVFRNNRSSLSPTTCQIGCRGGAISVEGGSQPGEYQ